MLRKHNRLLAEGLCKTRQGRSGWKISVFAVLSLSVGFWAHAEKARLAWAKRAGGTQNDDGLAVAVNTNGNVFVTGHFRLTATFGAGDPNPTLLTALGQDVFVAKYAPGGGLLWVRQARAQAGWGTAIGADNAGNCYVFGYFGPTITFAAGQSNQVVMNALANDLFLAKYDGEGNFLWAKQAGGSFSEYAYGIAVDGAGNSYVTGQYGSDPATFGAGEPNQTALAGIGGNNGQDIFIAKYDTNGQLQWAKSAGGRTGNVGAGIALDPVGNSYVVGRYTSTSTFGPGEPNETVLVGPLGGSEEIFVAKFGPDGNLAWVRSGLGQAEHDQGTAIAVDAAGNSYATGTYRSIAPFGGQLNQTQIDNGGAEDVFIVKHDTNGNQQWVTMAVGPNGEFARGIAVDSEGSAYITGYGFYMTFGAGEPNEKTLGGIGQNDVFLAKYATDGLLQWVRFDGGTGDDRGQAIAFAADAIHVVGRFGQTATFGAGEPNETALTFAGGSDIFVAKFLPTGGTTQPATFAGFGLRPNGNPELRISGTASQTYTIRRSSSLTDPTWNDVGNIVLDAQGTGVFEDTDEALEFPAFYQAVGN
ncbi:MAG TPA: SBBP repeat-containing protein [Verrucomicrobiota bacterium]|nr:hypothetical protein [Verrucomicrobiales bacterium]HRI11902.1 SBBP repeat-containing protein [Verrucomicrobiota bacterium]